MAQCQATTKRGTKCLNETVEGQLFCAEHGGRSGRTRARELLEDVPGRQATADALRRELQREQLQQNPLYPYVKAKAAEGDPDALALLAQLGETPA